MTVPHGTPALPMFYRELVALDSSVHLGFGVRPQVSLVSAANANAVPLGVSEFWYASTCYPIVFGPAGDAGFPVVITALVEGRNLFVDEQGHWLPEVYVPGWLRLYPFWLQPDQSGDDARLWFDPQAQQVVPLHEHADARPLFDYQGQPTSTLSAILQFCAQCQQDVGLTYAFMQALERHQLLKDQQVTVTLPSGAPYTLQGFRVVDMHAYHQLPDAVLAQWVRQGWTSLVALHQFSMQRGWEGLLALHQRLNA